MTRISRRIAAFFASGMLCSAAAYAEPSPQQKAAAEALFQAAAELLAQARHLEACEKFEASYSLDPTLGTRLRLADCYDRIGRSASAWALFVEVASVSRAQGQTAREQIAQVRIRDLESRLSRLTIETEASDALDSFLVTLNGTKIPKALWEVPIPVDPGTQLVEVTAPGYRPWSARIEVPRGPSERSLSVPALERLPASPSAPLMAPWSSQPALRPSAAKPLAEERSLLWAGLVSGAAGLIGLGVGGVFAYRAYDLNQDSLEQCSSADANACTALGKERRDDAQAAANVATAATIAGGTVLALGVTLLVLPSLSRKHETGAAIRLRGSAGVGLTQLKLEGGF